MLDISNFHDYQLRSVNHQIANPNSFLWAFMGSGKQQPNSEPVLTPNGWGSIGGLKVGDFAIGSDGLPTEVLGVFPQGDCEVVEFTFSDGATCRSGWEHLWYVLTPRQKKHGLVGHVLTTKQLVEGGLVKPFGNRNNAVWHIPMVQPVQFPEADLRIEPYQLGVILGDGTITESGHCTVCTDLDLIRDGGFRYLRPHKNSPYTGYGSVLGLTPHTRHYGLAGKRSWEKFVPVEYMTGSVAQRYALLQGLLDTDGSPSKCGAEFSSTSEQLTDAVVGLTQSLGGVARKAGPRTTYHQNGAGRPSWRVNVKLPKELPPFRLQRKLDKWVAPDKYPPARLITGHEVVGVEASTCIKVAAHDALYVTKDYILTHNTAVTETTIAHLQKHDAIRAALVCGPLRVVQSVWAQEAKKWRHTTGLRFSLIHGTAAERLRALFRPADVYLINYEGLVWLAAQLQHYFVNRGTLLPFDMLVLDESTKMKNIESQRVAAMIPYLQYFKYRTGLTGTPASNGLKDIFGQFLMIDAGERFGTDRDNFLASYFTQDGYEGRNYVATEAGDQYIKARCADIVLELSEEDYADLPDLIINDIYVDLAPKHRRQYEEIEMQLFTELDNGVELEINGEGAKSTKCLQYSNGAIITNTETREWHPTHKAKLDALDEIIEEASGEPILLGYMYRADAERILKQYPYAKNLTGMSGDLFNQTLLDWQEGRIPLLLGHPASVAHGVDGLQKRGHILVMFGLPWSLELYLQLLKRLHRQGQGVPVTCHRILTRDTLDDAVRRALDVKEQTQADLRRAVSEYRKAKEGRVH